MAAQPSRRKWPKVVRHGRQAVGKVSIWGQWLMVTTGVLLSPVFFLFVALFLGWPRIRRLWPGWLIINRPRQ
jgi:hypothetical protein